MAKSLGLFVALALTPLTEGYALRGMAARFVSGSVYTARAPPPTANLFENIGACT